MTVWNMITVQTGDHGPVETQCPDWCTGDSHPDGCDRADITHTGLDTVIEVPTPRGPVELFMLALAQYPYRELDDERSVHTSLFFANHDGWPTDPDDFDELAASITAAVAAAGRVVHRLHSEAQGGEEQ